MTHFIVLLLALGIGVAQAPPIQNGRVETRQTSAIERELGRIAGSVDPGVGSTTHASAGDGVAGVASGPSDTTPSAVVDGVGVGVVGGVME